MRINSNFIKSLIKQRLLKEDSTDAYARFVMHMEKLAAFSEKSSVMSYYKKENPELYDRMKKLGRKFVKRIQGDFPGTIDIDALNTIISSAKKAKQKDPSIDYGAKVIDLASNYWFDNVGGGRSARMEHGGGHLVAADPRARGDVAKSIDRTLKAAWQAEADQPENKKFWDNFEVWHSIGGIVGGKGGLAHDTILGFLNAFKTNNPHEMSAFGWSGNINASDDENLNRGIQSMITNEKGWIDKTHVKLDGNITFAANFDITTQWFSYKEDNDDDFEKSGDFNKMLNHGKFGSLITGPKDKLLSGFDAYNEIVIKDAKVVGISFPPAFFKQLKDIGRHRFARNVNLNYIGALILDGETERVSAKLLDAYNEGILTHYGNWYASSIAELIRAMIEGNKTSLSKDNRVIDAVNNISKYFKYDIQIYENSSGSNKTNSIKTLIKNLNACIDFIENNPELSSRKKINWYEWIKIKKPNKVLFINKLLQYVKKPEVKKFINSNEGVKFFREKQKEYGAGQTLMGAQQRRDDILNPEFFLKQIVPHIYSGDDWSGVPVELTSLLNTGVVITKMENNNSVSHPFHNTPQHTTIPHETTKDQKDDRIMLPPYFIKVTWRDELGGRQKYYEDDIKRSFAFSPHQMKAQEIIKMYQGIINRGGEIINFSMYDNVIFKDYIPVPDINQLKKLLIPGLTKLVAEVRLTRKQLSELIKNI